MYTSYFDDSLVTLHRWFVSNTSPSKNPIKTPTMLCARQRGPAHEIHMQKRMRCLTFLVECSDKICILLLSANIISSSFFKKNFALRTTYLFHRLNGTTVWFTNEKHHQLFFPHFPSKISHGYRYTAYIETSHLPQYICTNIGPKG